MFLTFWNVIYRCTEYCNLPSGTPVFSRLECDDSAAMYGAIIQETTKCNSVTDYLDMCWRELFLGDVPSPTNCHLFRSHAMNMLSRNLQKPAYGIHTKGGRYRLQTLFGLFIKSASMNEVVYYVQRIFTLLLNKFLTKEVIEIMDTYEQPMPSTFSSGTVTYGQCVA